MLKRTSGKYRQLNQVLGLLGGVVLLVGLGNLTGCLDPSLLGNASVGLTTDGPATVAAGETASFQATARNILDNSTTDVTQNAQWTVTQGPGSFSGPGVYTAPATVTEPTTVTLSVAYSSGTLSDNVTQTLTVTPGTAATPTPTPAPSVPTPSPASNPTLTPTPSPDPTSAPGSGPTPTQSPAPTPPAGTGAPMTTASQTSGPGPLAVFFDAVGSASGVVQPSGGDFGSMYYQWNFGDTGSGNWSTDAKSRNEATGFVAAHVYETPGTYHVTLSVTDPSGQVTTYTQDITVQAFSGTTYYVSSSGGNDSNDGLSASTPFKSFDKAMALAASNTSILFKRGDTWSGGGATLSAAGPGVIGAYGNASDPKPVINVDTGSAFTVTGADWRIEDLKLVGSGATSDGSGVNGFGGNCTKWLLLRLEIHGFIFGAGNTAWPTNYAHDHIFVVDCDMSMNGSSTSAGHNMYLAGKRLVVMGTRSEGVQNRAEHCLRIWDTQKCVISHDILRNPMATKHSLKLHSNGLSQYIEISDNRFRGDAWACSIGPQDSGSNEVVKDVIVERNVVEAYPGGALGFQIAAQNVTLRNNIVDATGSGMALASIAPRGSEPAPVGCVVYHNDLYRGDGGAAYLMDTVQPDTQVKNNLAYATSGSVALGGSGSNWANNLTGNPLWVNPGAGDFHLQSGSPAKGAGTNVPVRDDFEGNPRPTSAPDLGAFDAP